jgi:hypothetical protein
MWTSVCITVSYESPNSVITGAIKIIGQALILQITSTIHGSLRVNVCTTATARVTLAIVSWFVPCLSSNLFSSFSSSLFSSLSPSLVSSGSSQRWITLLLRSISTPMSRRQAWFHVSPRSAAGFMGPACVSASSEGGTSRPSSPITSSGSWRFGPSSTGRPGAR